MGDGVKKKHPKPKKKLSSTSPRKRATLPDIRAMNPTEKRNIVIVGTSLPTPA
jgi:hypothetical protein